MASKKELKEGTRIILRTSDEDIHGVVVDNLSSMYFLEMDDGTEVFISKGDVGTHIKKEH